MKLHRNQMSKQSTTQVETINQGRRTGELNQKPGHEGKHGLEQQTALNLEMKVIHNHTEGPGQTGLNKMFELFCE